MSGAARVTVDPDVCMASGACVLAAPNSFRIDEALDVSVVVDAAGDPLSDLLAAMDACPTGAITVETDDDA